MENKEQFISDLTLALAYLTSWDEKDVTGGTISRAWKGYDFGTLDKLKEEGLIDFSYKAKSLYLTEDGEKRAKDLVRNFKVSES